MLVYVNNYKKPKNKYDYYIDSRWYKRFSDSKTLVHRYIASKKLWRKLLPREVVHHKNRNKIDNRPANLQIFASQEEHNKLHQKWIINWNLRKLYWKIQQYFWSNKSSHLLQS